MKFLHKYFPILILLLLLAESLPTLALENDSFLTKKNDTAQEITMPEIVILGGVSTDSVSLFESLLSRIPDEILSDLRSQEIRIFLVPDGSYSEGHAGMFVVSDFVWSGRYFHTKENVTDSPLGYIALNTSSSSKIKMSVIHEIGHFVDERLGIANGYSPDHKYDARYYSQNPEFTEIFMEEGPLSGYPSWNLQDEQEYFAESFRMLFEQPQKLEKLPRTRDFLTKTLSDFYKLSF